MNCNNVSCEYCMCGICCNLMDFYCNYKDSKSNLT